MPILREKPQAPSQGPKLEYDFGDEGGKNLHTFAERMRVLTGSNVVVTANENQPNARGTIQFPEGVELTDERVEEIRLCLGAKTVSLLRGKKPTPLAGTPRAVPEFDLDSCLEDL